MSSFSSTFALLDIGGGEMMLIFFIVLMLFGGQKLPEFARGLGKSIREFKKATAGVEDEIKRAMEEPPPKPRPAPTAAIEPAPAAPTSETPVAKPADRTTPPPPEPPAV
ncbi:MAG TPA: twin-arginine translocase TatA/TatE family subunit [Rariglobus sp.]